MLNSLPKYYNSILNEKETSQAFEIIKKEIYSALKNQYTLLEINLPNFIKYNSNKNLYQKNINFDTKDDLQIYSLPVDFDNLLLKSLVKFKMKNNEGIITNNVYIDRDLTPNPTQFYSVNEIDVELKITDENRNFKYLNNSFYFINKMLVDLNDILIKKFSKLKFLFKDKIKVISFQEIEKEFGYLSLEERINAIVEKHNIVLIYGMNSKLNSGKQLEQKEKKYNEEELDAKLFVYNNFYHRSYDILRLSIREKDSLKNILNVNDLNHGEKTYELDGTSFSFKINLFKLSLFLLEKAHISEIQNILD